MKTIGLLHTTIRGDEKLIMESATRMGVRLELIDVREQILSSAYTPQFDIALERCVSTTKGDVMTAFLETMGIPVVNSSVVAANCGDKFRTSLLLDKAGVPTPAFGMVFDIAQAHTLVEQLGGFPVVLKPPVGSWGRLLAKINDADALEALIEHKDVLGGPQQKNYYIQKFVEKPGRDIRVFVVGDEAICAIYRNSPHWITNTARGGKAENCQIGSELKDISLRAARAVGGGILAMDVFETKDGYTINEINHTMEFKNSEKPTGVSISSKIVEYCISHI